MKVNVLPSITLHTEATEIIVVDFGEENFRRLQHCVQSRVAYVSQPKTNVTTGSYDGNVTTHITQSSTARWLGDNGLKQSGMGMKKSIH